jgi:signal transduction histidine kinase
MLRRSLVIVPLLAAAAALLGAWLRGRPTLAACLAALAALAVAAGLEAVAERRVRRVADRVARIAAMPLSVHDPQPLGVETPVLRAGPVPLASSRGWRRLTSGLDAVGASLQQRFDELADERARVERLLEGLPTAVLLFADEGLAYANPAACELFGVDRSEARTPLQVLGARALADAVVEARETGRAVEVEVGRDGRELAARASVATPGEVVLVVSDLTDLRRVEEIRRDFVTNASHELKTPVAGMQALSDSLALAFRRDPQRAGRMIERLQHEASRLAKLVRDLLDLARLEEATVERARRPVDLAEIVRDQCAHVEPLARVRRIAIRCDSAVHAPVVAVPEDLRLIAANLLENAVRYNRRGGRVDVSLLRRGGEVVLSVADTGIGIAAADQDRVFERFYRVDKARSRAVGGTGLGLSIVRHAAERHGGSVRVHSVLGEGSTFIVTLPVEGSSVHDGHPRR